MGKQCCNPLNKVRHPSVRKTIGIRPITSEVFEQCKQHLPEYQWKENMTVCTGCRSSISSKIKMISSSKIDESLKVLDQVQKFEVENMDSDPSLRLLSSENDGLNAALETKENIVETENVRHKCLICAVEFMQRKPQILQENNASPARRASSLRKKVLDEHSIFFALNDCLGISLQQCEDLFCNLIENFGEPGHWGVSFCSDHAGIIEELNQIHNTVLQLETKREKLMKKLKRDVTVSLKSKQNVEYEGQSQAFKGIRDSLENVFLPGIANAMTPASVNISKKLIKTTNDCKNCIRTTNFMGEMDEEPITLPDIKLEIEDDVNEDVTVECFDWNDALSMNNDNIGEDENYYGDNFEQDNPYISIKHGSIVRDSVSLVKELSSAKDNLSEDFSSNHDSNYDSSKKFQSLKIRKNTKRNSRKKTKTPKIKNIPAVKRQIIKLEKKSATARNGYRFRCRVCSERFLTLELRDAHQIEKHGPGKHFSCATCGEKFSTSGSLLYHTGRKHSDKKPFPCDQCPKAYSFLNDLTKHKQRSHDYRMMKCSHCGREYQGKHKLNQHIRITCLKKYYRPPIKKTCEFCGKVYSSPPEFRKHQAKEHFATYERVVCDECGKSLADAKSLEKHKQAIHLKNYKHKCTICGHQSLFKSHLEAHMKSAHADGVNSGTQSAKNEKLKVLS